MEINARLNLEYTPSPFGLFSFEIVRESSDVVRVLYGKLQNRFSYSKLW